MNWVLRVAGLIALFAVASSAQNSVGGWDPEDLKNAEETVATLIDDDNAGDSSSLGWDKANFVAHDFGARHWLTAVAHRHGSDSIRDGAVGTVSHLDRLAVLAALERGRAVGPAVDGEERDRPLLLAVITQIQQS